MNSWLLAFFCLTTAGCLNVTDQQTSESQHDQQVAILKQIRKLNEDGSYTYGFEADDGSFKVESRDVLGNIKGTFGFVDATGEVKRVSYSSSNGTGFKSTTVLPLQEQISVIQNIPLKNHTSNNKKPNLYTMSTDSAIKTNAIQSISRTHKLTTSPTISTTTAMTMKNPIGLNFIRPKARHRFIINGQQRPLIFEDEEIINEDSQITRPNANNKAINMRRIVFTKRPLGHNLRPITEEFEDKEEELKATTGNILRRQLQEETSKAAPVIEQEEDHVDIYGGALSTSRPLFTTTTSPRVFQKLSELRQDQQKHIYINQDSGVAKFVQDQNFYDQKESKQPHQEDHHTAQQIVIRTTTHTPTETRDYIHQNPEPINAHQHSESYLPGISTGGILVQAHGNHLDEDPLYGQITLSKLLLKPEFNRFLPNQQPLYSSTNDVNVHYITDTSLSTQNQEETASRIPINSAYLAQQKANYQRQLSYSEAIADPRTVLLRQFSQQVPFDEREHQNLGSDYHYRMTQIALPPELQNSIPPPLSRRDFQKLLRRLLVSQYGTHALNYPKTYLENALYDQQSYPFDQSSYKTPIPRTEIPYPSEPGKLLTSVSPVISSLPYSERIPLRRTQVYSKTINPLHQRNQYEDYSEPRYQKRVYRQKFYSQEVPDDVEEILPPQIREALLLRMLQLAITAEKPITTPTTMVISTTIPPVKYQKSGPIRNVQILGEDMEEEKRLKKKV